MRAGRLQRAARPEQRILQRGADHPRSADRPAVPGQHHPGEPAQRQRPRAAERVPAADARLPARATGERDRHSDNPQDQRKDNIRFDYRLNDKNQFTYRYGKYNWTAVDAFRGTFPYARTDWDRPNTTQTASWTSTITNNADQRVQLHLLARRGVHQRVPRHRPLQAQQVRHQLSVHLPGRTRRSRTRSRRSRIDNFTEIDGGPYPVLVAWADPHVHERDDLGARAGTRSRPASCSSTRVRTTSTRSTSSRFPAAPTTRTAASSSRNGGTGAHRRRRSPTRRWACSRATPRSASAR